MNKKKILLIGGGGHFKSTISQLKKQRVFEIIGLIDNFKPIGNLVAGIKIIGTDNDLESYYKKGINYALITIGSVKDNIKRYELFNQAKKIGFIFPIVISPSAKIDNSVEINEGTTIMSGSIINVDASIGKNCIINTGAIIEHDCKIGDHCHIAPGTHISGSVEIGDLSFIGVGSTIVQGIKIGRNVTIGAGSVVFKDIQDNVIMLGNPARLVRKK